MRIIAEFRKEGPARYISHLDLMRTMQRGMRRAGLPVAYSQGFNPHALLSFATAVPVGCTSRCEIMDCQMQQDIQPDAFVAQLNAALPKGIALNRALAAQPDLPAPMAAVQAAEYTIEVAGDVSEQIADFMASQQWIAVKQSKKGKRDTDIRPLVYQLAAREGGLHCILRHDNALALKPALLMEALAIDAGDICRTALLIRQQDGYRPLYGLYERGHL